MREHGDLSLLAVKLAIYGSGRAMEGDRIDDSNWEVILNLRHIDLRSQLLIAIGLASIEWSFGSQSLSCAVDALPYTGHFARFFERKDLTNPALLMPSRGTWKRRDLQGFGMWLATDEATLTNLNIFLQNVSSVDQRQLLLGLTGSIVTQVCRDWALATKLSRIRAVVC